MFAHFLFAAALTAQVINGPNAPLEPSLQNEVSHALERVRSQNSEDHILSQSDIFGTNGLSVAQCAIRLLSLQNAHGRWIIHGIDVTEEAVAILSNLSDLPPTRAQDEGFYVLCRFDLKPETDRADYVAKTRAVTDLVRAEKGCRMYTLLEDAQTDWEAPQRFGTRTFWMLEHWSSIDALKNHLATPHMKDFGPRVRPLRSASTFHVLQPAR